MYYFDRETSPPGPYIPIFSRRSHDLARVRDLGVDLFSHVTYCLCLLNRSPRAILRNNSSSFTYFFWCVYWSMIMCEGFLSDVPQKFGRWAPNLPFPTPSFLFSSICRYGVLDFHQFKSYQTYFTASITFRSSSNEAHASPTVSVLLWSYFGPPDHHFGVSLCNCQSIHFSNV